MVNLSYNTNLLAKLPASRDMHFESRLLSLTDNPCILAIMDKTHFDLWLQFLFNAGPENRAKGRGSTSALQEFRDVEAVTLLKGASSSEHVPKWESFLGGDESKLVLISRVEF